MKCTDLEILVCDYVDGTLSPAEKATVELHLTACADCRELVADSRAALSFLERVPEVEPPAALVNKILFEARAQGAEPAKKKTVHGWFGRLFEPLLQPRFAMGMAMTILSFSMLGRLAGIPSRQLKPSDLEPAKIWSSLEDKAYRNWERAVKYYQSLRTVYEIQNTLKDWTEPADDAAAKGSTSEGGKTPVEGPIEKKNESASPPAGNEGSARK